MNKVINRYQLDGNMLVRYADDSLRWMTWLDSSDEEPFGGEGMEPLFTHHVDGGFDQHGSGFATLATSGATDRF